MSSLQLNIRWNRYETALLVEAYEKVSQKVISRKDAVAQLSKQLRNGSAAMGLNISDTFRNENGISMQMTVIKNILTNSDSSFGSSSKVFLEVCNLYLNDKQSYGQILERAKKMYPSNNADRLKTYAPVDEEEVQVIADPLTNSDKKKSYIRNVYNKISNKIKIGFSTQSKPSSQEESYSTMVEASYEVGSSYPTIDTDESIEDKSANTITEDEIAVISMNQSILQKNYIVDVFRGKFRNGMKMGSSLAIRKFRRYYQQVSGISIDEISDNIITSTVERCAVVYNNIAYLPELMLPEQLSNTILGYVQEQFLNGREYIFYSKLYDHFQQKLLDSQIIDADMLRLYLEHENKNGWFFQEDFFTTQRDMKINTERIVLKFMKETNNVVTEEDIIRALPQLPKEDVLQSFRFNGDILISTGRGQGKIHIDHFQITEDDLAKIKSVLYNEIRRTSFMLWPELLQTIRGIAPNVLDYNEQFNELGIRKVLSIKLSEWFYFNNNIISLPGQQISSKDVLINFAKTNEEYTLDDAKEICESMQTNINANMDLFLMENIRIDADHFVSKHKIRFDVTAIDKVIAGYCPNEYIPIKDIQNFSLFPSCGYSWNQLLLESYVFSCSKLFKLEHNIFGSTQALGAIVKKTSPLEYDDVMAEILAQSDTVLKATDALNFFVEKGLIGRRRLGNVNEILKKAHSIRKDKTTK